MEGHILSCVHFSCAIRQHLDRAVASAEAPGRLDPLIDSIVGDQHEGVIDDDAKQFAAHALASSESGQRQGPCVVTSIYQTS